MHLQIQNLAALDLCNATAKGWVDRVESLLNLGVDPNARFDGSDFSALPDLVDDAAPGVKPKQPPQFAWDTTEMPSLRRAPRHEYGIEIPEACDLIKTARLLMILLKHGADPYAFFRQPITSHKLFCVPVENNMDSEYDDVEAEVDLE